MWENRLRLRQKKKVNQIQLSTLERSSREIICESSSKASWSKLGIPSPCRTEGEVNRGGTPGQDI